MITNFNIDFRKMVESLLGKISRGPKRIAWLTAALKPVEYLHAAFVEYVTSKRDEVKWNGQTIVLENLLIEKFGAGIYIENNVLELNGPFVGEGNDTAFYVGEGSDVSQFVDIEYTITGTNFTVYVPASVSFVESEMRAYINKYKIFGATYEIIILP